VAERRALIVAGGTGGHFYPGLVLAQELRARGWEPLVVVRTGDPARSALDAAGLPWVELELRGLPRSLKAELFTFPFQLGRALAAARRVVKDFEPRAVFGTGGYLTVPCAAAAAARGLPRLVHESNAALGLANRVSAAIGARLFWGLPPVAGQGEVVGTPIRPALWDARDQAECRRELGLEPSIATVLVFGGSQGARGLNREAPAALKGEQAQVLHLAGPKEADAVRAAYGSAKAKVLPYLEKMELAYGAADLVICRAGASTIAELSAQRKPALLVPLPTAAGNHQEINARAVAARGAAEVALEAELPARLPGLLRDLLISGEAARRRRAMSESWSKLALPPPSLAPGLLADAFESAAKR